MWRRYVSDAHGCCAQPFWKLYEAVQGQTVHCRDAVLKVMSDLVDPQLKKRAWPRSNRTLRALVDRTAGSFWDHVLYTYTIDLRPFGLPSCDSVPFSFVDPIYVWLHQCNVLCEGGVSFQWVPKTLHHPVTGEDMFGAGIEYSLLLRDATASIPSGGRVALLNLSWDSGVTGFGGRSAVPICVQVMNADALSAKTVGLVGYLPYIQVSEAYKNNKNYIQAKRHVLQVSGM